MDYIYKSFLGFFGINEDKTKWRSLHPPFNDGHEDELKRDAERIKAMFPPDKFFDEEVKFKPFYSEDPTDQDDLSHHVNFYFNPEEIFQEFEGMFFREMDEVFRGMIPGVAVHPPYTINDNNSTRSRSLRDWMLKDPDPPSREITEPCPPRDWIKTPATPLSHNPDCCRDPDSHPGTDPGINPGTDPFHQQQQQHSSWFRRLWSSSRTAPREERKDMADTTLTPEVIDKIILDNITPDNSPFMRRKRYSTGPDTGTDPDSSDSDLEREVARQRSGGVFKRVTVHTYRNVDGAVEERRSIQRGDGEKESTIQRTIGDQTYSITTKKHPGRDDEVLENYVNMDEADKKAFDERWQTSKMPSIRDRPGSVLDPVSRDPQVIVDQETGKIFQNLFRMGFPGFVKKD